MRLPWKKISGKFNLGKPVVVADSGLLSKPNIKALDENGYEYIIGARLKNESIAIQEEIVGQAYTEGAYYTLKKSETTRLIVHYAGKRAKKDAYNRQKGLKRLEKRIKSGKLTKSTINNRGYNKYLQLEGEIEVNIDDKKFEEDSVWDGLKGDITNTKLSDDIVLENYRNLFEIERAFRMSKTDWRIRPIYHRLRHRIEAHICIAFTAYCIYKELERVLRKEKSSLSLKMASEITHNMYQITYQLPQSKHIKKRLLNMDEQQTELHKIISKYFGGCPNAENRKNIRLRGYVCLTWKYSSDQRL